MLKLLSFFKHHGFLAVDDLLGHRVVEVGNLFEGDSFLVEFLSILSHCVNVGWDSEAVFTEDASIFGQGNQSF